MAHMSMPGGMEWIIILFSLFAGIQSLFFYLLILLKSYMM
jgi:hypothetical protein